MEKAITAADASRRPSKLLRAVRDGNSYVVTLRGKAIARVVPFQKEAGILPAARAALVKRLRSQPVANVGRWSRQELYEDQ